MFSTSGLWGCVLDGRVSVVVEDGSAAFGGVLVEEPGPVLGYLGLVVACFISADVEVHTCSVTDQQARACVWLRLAGLYFWVCTFRVSGPVATVGAAGFYEGWKRL